MRKAFKMVIILLLYGFLFMFTSAYAYLANDKIPGVEQAVGVHRDDYVGESTLPAGLLEIGDNAFEGTALTQVRLQQKVKSIGSRAFANISSLRMIYLSPSIESIGEEIFAGSGQVMIAGATNGNARRWAVENGYPFSPVAMVTTQSGIHGFSGFLEPFREKQENENKGTVEYVPDYSRERRTGRSIGELKASHFKGCVAQHVQSRYFP